jgi:hypothetical protein
MYTSSINVFAPSSRGLIPSRHSIIRESYTQFSDKLESPRARLTTCTA